jgi:hypothetical protein
MLLLSSCGVPSKMPRGASWDKPSGTFQWSQGEVRVPAALYYRDGYGVDSFEGNFHTLDEALVIHHDIGGYAGAYAQQHDAVLFEERVVEGARAWVAQEKQIRGDLPAKFIVTFPDNGCANFWIESWDRSGLDLVRSIADSFRSKRTQKSSNLCEQRSPRLQ